MECHEIQELMLESFEQALTREAQAHIDAHVETCVECSRFARIQTTLDHRLIELLVPPPTLTTASRLALRAGVRGRARIAAQDARPSRTDLLPEIVHFGSFAVATLVMAAVLPASNSVVAGIGATVALGSYVLLSVVRETFDDSALGADV
jgi:hypothetical protein